MEKFRMPFNRKIHLSLLASCVLCLGMKATAEDLPLGSYQTMDYGPVIGETIVAAWPENNISYKGLAIRLDHEAAVIFDTDLMRWSAAAVGGWIDLSKTSHTSYKGSKPATVEGREIFATAPLPGWAREGTFQDPRPEARGNLPADWARWGGYFRHGDRVTLSYTVGGVEVLESPSAVEVGDTIVLVRSIQASASEEEMIAYVAEAPPETNLEWSDGSLLAVGEETSRVFYVESALDGVELEAANGRIELVIPPHAKPVAVKVLMWEGGPDGRPARGEVTAAVDRQSNDITAALYGGPARWEEELETSVELAPDEAAYVVDKIELPFENPWGSWIRTSAFDFFEDGKRAALSTWNGDVWIVSGLGDGMSQVKWRRFASGLFYPMGLVIVDETIHVIEGSQLTRLHDLNGNGEADFYENVNNEGVLHPMAHTIALEVDSKGNFYFFKNGNRAPGSVPDHGALIRVSADGARREAVSTGIRGANTLGIGPGDVILGADQQGDWVPSTRVDWLREGGYYGYVRHRGDDRPEGDYDPPIFWVPHGVDNSTGAISYTGDERWGPMHQNWIMTSYGRSVLFSLLLEKKGGQMQGGVVQFPLEFSSGLMRARMGPDDGQLYLMGMKGWQTTAQEDGSFERVRYTGLPNYLPTALNVEPGGIRITFSNVLDPKSIDAKAFDVERWEYVYSKNYGSPEMSVANPGEKGRDSVEVSGAVLSDDGKSIFVEIPDLKPVMQMSISYRLEFADGGVGENAIYHTIHRLSEQDDVDPPKADEPAVAKSDSGGASEAAGAEKEEWADFAAGRKVFDMTCSTCHRTDGGGVAPALSESPWPSGSSEALVRIVLQGKEGEDSQMMPFSWLSDEDIASLLSYIRVRWHGEAPVSEAEVREIRAASRDRSSPWTEEELLELGK